MLDTIRRNATSWGVKILFAIIALVFVFWGIGSFRARNKGLLAKVGDHYIKTRDFVEAYQQEVEKMRRIWSNISETTLNKLGFKKRVFDRMVNDIVLTDMARGLGIVVPPSQIKKNIENTRFFWNKDKQFDFDRYKQVLAYIGLTPAAYEIKIEKEFTKQKLLDFVALAAYVTEKEAKSYFDFFFQRAKINYILFPTKEFKKKIKISKKEIKKYYDDHKDQFVVPVRIKIKYVLITPEELSKIENVSLDEMKKYYEEHKEDFKTKPAVKLSHIYIRLSEDMKDKKKKKQEKKLKKILRLIAKGKSFKSLAKRYSESPDAKDGGALGWIEEDSLISKVKKEIMSLKVGNVSKPIKTKDGVHIFKLEDKRGVYIKPFEEVRDEIRDTLARIKATDDLDSTLDSALETLLRSNDLDKVAQKIGLKVHESGFFAMDTGLADVYIKRDDLKTIFNLKKGKILETPITLKNGYIIVQKIDEKPKRIKALKEVKDDIVDKLKEEKARNLAKNEAQKVLSLVKQGKEKGLKYKIKISEYFTREGYIPGLGYNKKFVQDIFSSKMDVWLDETYDMGNGFLIAKLIDKKPPNIKKWEKEKNKWISMLERNTKNMLFISFLNGIRHNIKIKILAPEILQ